MKSFLKTLMFETYFCAHLDTTMATLQELIQLSKEQLMLNIITETQEEEEALRILLGVHFFLTFFETTDCSLCDLMFVLSF